MPDASRFEWSAARRYLEGLLPQAIRELEAPVPPEITAAKPSIGPEAAQLLTVLIHATRPKRALEIGTGLGYSAIAMGRALERVGARLTTIELDPRLAGAARQNIADAGLSDLVEVIIADANEVIANIAGPFGLILQDGHKPDYIRMLPRVVELLEPGGLLVSDDVLFPVMDLPESASLSQHAIRDYNEALKNRPDLETTWLPIGDGVAVSVKSGGPTRETWTPS
jgi:predicted O-methyltransferase YrrM